jgi:hypothetical protein
MNKSQLKKLQKNGDFKRVMTKYGLKHKKGKNKILILILLAVIIYLIFTKANIYFIIGLTVLLILLMR